MTVQAGAYIRDALSDPDGRERWCAQIANLLEPYISKDASVMEVGSGESTTLAGVLESLSLIPKTALGFDISWSRCNQGRGWLKYKGQQADLFVADMFNIPLADSSVDVVYTAHSLEPNGGRERQALQELIRVTKRALVLVEPIFELAPPPAQERMKHHGYVRNLKATAEQFGCKVVDYRMLDFFGNDLNPSGVICIVKSEVLNYKPTTWRCPLTHASLDRGHNAFHSPETGIVYPLLDGIPLLCRDHAVLASGYGQPFSL